MIRKVRIDRGCQNTTKYENGKEIIQIENIGICNRTKKYHETTRDNLISILKKNKKKLQIDPPRRDFEDTLSAELDKGLQKLAPVTRKIEVTNHLIDQIGYRIYKLTEEGTKTGEKRAIG